MFPSAPFLPECGPCGRTRCSEARVTGRPARPAWKAAVLRILPAVAALATLHSGCSKTRVGGPSPAADVVETDESGVPGPGATRPSIFEAPVVDRPPSLGRSIEPPSGLPGRESTVPQAVSFATPDGVVIEASYWKAGDPAAPTVVFAHQARSDRWEWEPFVRELRARAPGIAALALDLRGHGESVRAGDRALAWRRFSPGDHPGVARWAGATVDVQAAIAFLRARVEGSTPRAIGLVGSSIGATSVIRAAAADGVEGPGRVAAVVVVSPGMSYFSVPIKDALQTLKVRKFPVLAIAARDDSGDCVGAIDAMRAVMGELLQPVIYSEGGHGVGVARTHGEVVPLVVQYLKTQLGD